MYSDVFSKDYSAKVEITDIAQAEDFSLSTALTIDQEIGTHLGGDLRTITRSGTPAMGSAMFIGGLNSLNANAQPLVVVDGVIWDLQEGIQALLRGQDRLYGLHQPGRFRFTALLEGFAGPYNRQDSTTFGKHRV